MQAESRSPLLCISSIWPKRGKTGNDIIQSNNHRDHRYSMPDAFNRADSIFRSTDEAQALVDYFEKHGTPNEQMLAYYLLGRAYHDLHEAPMALKYFQIASERADTTATDCDYAQLSRVYGQMSAVFYQQNLMRQSLEKANLSEMYGWKGKDTLNALISKGGKIFAYKRLSEPDSAIIIMSLCLAFLILPRISQEAERYITIQKVIIILKLIS